MGAEKATAEDLRAALAKYRQSGRYVRYPEALRYKAQDYAQQRHQWGASVATISAELGVSAFTAKAWATPSAVLDDTWVKNSVACRPLSFVPVVVAPETRDVTAPAETGQVEVQFADGTRLRATGFGTQGLIQALDTLRSRR